MIKPLSQQTAQDLCAQQVITSLPDVIKQLIDNSIDAKATFIKITLHKYGRDKVEVIDNGMGIDNFDFLGKKGTTSKNKCNDKIEYLGFRGQAIHSIGRVSGNMQIESKCAKDGHRRIFNVVTQTLQQFKQQRLCHSEFSFKQPNRQGSQNTGTKVQIQNIFEKLPIRLIQLQGKYKQFLRKTNEIIKDFCLIYPEIQFIFINRHEGKEDNLIETVNHKRFDRTTWLDRIKQMDQKVGNNLVYINHQLFQGYVLSKIESGSSKENAYIKKNYHYLYANRRPIDVIPAIQSTLNQIYKKYNNNTKYAFILNLKLSHTQVDLNLTPNKREIFVRKNVLDSITENLKYEITGKVIEDIPTLNSFQEKLDKKNNSRMTIQSQPDVFKSQQVFRQSVNFFSKDQEKLQQNQDRFNRNSTAMANPFNASKLVRQKKSIKSSKSSFEDVQLSKIAVDRNKLKEQLNNKMSIGFSGVRRYSEAPKPQIVTERQSKSFIESKQVKIEQRSDVQEKVVTHTKSAQMKFHSQTLIEQEIRKKSQNEVNDVCCEQKNSQLDVNEDDLQQNADVSYPGIVPKPHSMPKCKTKPDSQLQERIKAQLNKDMSQIFTNFNQRRIEQSEQESVRKVVFQEKEEQSKNASSKHNDSRDKEEKDNIIQQSCEPNAALYGQLGDLAPKSIKKEDFRSFEILGQYNYGFIICHFNSRIFMIDQHAADQKFRFQANLTKSKDPEVINCFEQRQINSIQFDEIEQAKELLEDAGFYYKVIDGTTLKLLRCPVFNEKKLGIQFFNEIVQQKRQLQRIAKFTAICAMMACRSATKVGQPLTKDQMKKQVENLATLNSPWNCPHGRPTLIELGSIKNFVIEHKKDKKYTL